MNANRSEDILSVKLRLLKHKHAQSTYSLSQSENCDYTLSPLDVSPTHTIDFDLSFPSLIQVEDKNTGLLEKQMKTNCCCN